MIKKNEIDIKNYRITEEIQKLVPKIQKLLLSINRSYWLIFIIFLSFVAFHILIIWINYLYSIVVEEENEFKVWIQFWIYLYFIPFILPLFTVIIAYWNINNKLPSMTHWKKVRNMILFFKGIYSNKHPKINGKISENMLKSILNLEKWLKALWINRYFLMILMLFVINFFIFSDIYHVSFQLEDGKFHLYFGFKDIFLWWTSFIIWVLFINFFAEMIYKKQMKIWSKKIKVLKNRYKNFVKEL